MKIEVERMCAVFGVTCYTCLTLNRFSADIILINRAKKPVDLMAALSSITQRRESS